MALRFVTIGSMVNVHVYEDGDFDYGIQTDGKAYIGTAPTNPNEVLRLTDIPTLGTIVAAAAVITDHSIVRGDGGARGIQDSGILIDDSDNLTLPDGAVFIAHNSDHSHLFSRAVIGYVGSGNEAGLQHRALALDGTNYAIQQLNLGTTYVNCVTGKEINFCRNDVTLVTLTQLTSLVDNSMVDTLHRHSELSASDGTPDRALVVDATGLVGIGTVGPAYPLDIESSLNTIIRVKSTDNRAAISVEDDDTQAAFGVEDGSAFINVGGGSLGSAELVIQSDGDVIISSGDLDLLEGGLFMASIFTGGPRIFLDNYHDDTNSSRIEFWKLPDTLSDDDQIGYIAGFTIRDSQPAAYMDFRISDETVDHTGGEVNFGVKVDDVSKYLLRLRGYTGTQGEAEVIFNDSAADVDFIIRKETAGDALVYDAGADTFTFGAPILLSGTGRIFRSIDIDITIPKRPVANPPGEGLEDGFPTLDFDDGTEESIRFELHMPHAYVSAGAVHSHVEFFVDTAPGGAANAGWGIEYKKVSHGDNFTFTGTTTIEVATAITTGTPANDKKIHESDALNFTTTGWEPGDTIYCRFYRNVGVASDFTGDIRIIAKIHTEYLSDKLGEAS